MLISCLKQLKDFILKFSVSGSTLQYLLLFLQLDMLMRLSTIEQIMTDTNMIFILLQYHTLTAIHFMNHEGLCQIIRTIFNIYICLNHC